jgi:hypothetical protein
VGPPREAVAACLSLVEALLGLRLLIEEIRRLRRLD